MKASRERAYAWARKHLAKILICVGAAIALSLLFGTSIFSIIAIAGLIMVASFSTFYFNYVSAPVNFELVKLSTILVAYTHGIMPGLAVGILSTVLGKVLIGRIDEKLPISVAAISVVAVAASLFGGVGIVALGITLVAIYNVVMFSITMLMGGDLAWNVPYEGTNFLINVVLFTRVAPLLLLLLK